MDPISFKRRRFPAAVIVQAVRWYFRFTFSIRDIWELMAEAARNGEWEGRLAGQWTELVRTRRTTLPTVSAAPR